VSTATGWPVQETVTEQARREIMTQSLWRGERQQPSSAFNCHNGFTMRFIGSAAVAVIVLWFIDERFNNGRFTHVAIVLSRQAFASIGILF
jgi:hypothetical protein